MLNFACSWLNLPAFVCFCLPFDWISLHFIVFAWFRLNLKLLILESEFAYISSCLFEFAYICLHFDIFACICLYLIASCLYLRICVCFRLSLPLLVFACDCLDLFEFAYMYTLFLKVLWNEKTRNWLRKHFGTY